MSTNNSKNIMNNTAKLKWACRRGMLELDVLLGNFLAERYEQLPDIEKFQFIELLNCTDPEIYAWILGQVPAPEAFKNITTLIRQHAQNRSHF